MSDTLVGIENIVVCLYLLARLRCTRLLIDNRPET